MKLSRISLIRARYKRYEEEIMSTKDDSVISDILKWKMRTAISMGALRTLERTVPEGTEIGDLVRKAIRDIEELT